MSIYDYQGNQISFETGEFSNRTVDDDKWTTSRAIDLHYANFGNEFSVGDRLASSPFISIEGAKFIEFVSMKTPDTGQVYYGTVFYDKNKTPIPGWGVASPHNNPDNERTSTTQRMFVPPAAKYMRTTYWAPAFRDSNNLPTFSVSSVDIPECDIPFTHELPLNPDMLRVVKRARQLTDIKWTSRVDVSRYDRIDGSWSGSSGTFLDWFKAGEEYQGIPYSGAGAPDVALGSVNTNYLSGQWGYIRFNVGLDVPLESFVTAARYPNSIMGITTEQSTAKFDSSPYGIFCSLFIMYALGGYSKFAYPSGGYFYPNIENIGTLSTVGVQSLRLCDVLETHAHLVLVSDIIRNPAGEIVSVEIAESNTRGNSNNSVNNGTSKLGGVCKRKAYNVNDLLFSFSGFSVKRMSDMNEIPYEQSGVVSVANEPDFERIIDYPCIPYLGNKAKYKVGYIVNSKILIGATGFTSLVVTKDGEDFATFTINGQTEIEAGFSAAGSYTAYLKSGTNKTIACEWTVE